jgi:hypothetical protein
VFSWALPFLSKEFGQYDSHLMYAPLDGPVGANSVLIIAIFNTIAQMLFQFAITFMQVIYNCINEASHVSRVYNVAAIL